jgi:hypothetical protein
MQRIRIALLPALIFGLAKHFRCDGAASQPSLNEQELTFLCSLPRGLKTYPHVSNIPKDRKESELKSRTGEAKERHDAVASSAIRCQGGFAN